MALEKINPRREDGHGSDPTNPTYVDVQGSTISVGNLQQFSNEADINEVHDLQAAPFIRNVTYSVDSIVKYLHISFIGTEEFTIRVTRTYEGIEKVVLFEKNTDELGNIVSPFEVEFGDDGQATEDTTFTITISQTTNPETIKVLWLSQIGASALAGNPVLGEGTSYIGNVGYGDSSALDAFGRLRVSQPQSLLAVKQIYANTDLFYGDFGDGTATFIPNKAGTELVIPSGTVGKHTLASHQHVSYQPGKSLFQQITAVWGDFTPGVIRRCGLRNAYGERIFLEQNGNDDTAYTVVESFAGLDYTVDSPDRRVIERNDWEDRLDGFGGGTNPSGIAVDPTKNQLIDIDFQWLSAGRLRFAYSFAGLPTVISKHEHGNVLDLPFTRCPEFQVFWEIETTSSQGVDVNFLAICSAISSEGGKEPSGISYGVTTGATPITVGTTFTPVLGIRSLAAYHSDPNVVTARLKSFGIHNDADVIYCVVWFPTAVTGGTWNPVGGHSSIEYSSDITSITGGQTIDEDIITVAGTGSKAQGNSLQDVLAQQEVICRNASNTGSIAMVLMVRAITGTADVYGSMRWVEDIG